MTSYDSCNSLFFNKIKALPLHRQREENISYDTRTLTY